MKKLIFILPLISLSTFAIDYETTFFKNKSFSNPNPTRKYSSEKNINKNKNEIEKKDEKKMKNLSKDFFLEFEKELKSIAVF